MNNSSLFSLNWKDLLNGFITAFLAAFVAQVGQSIDSGVLPTLVQLKASAIFGLVGGIGYLLKKLVSNSDGKIAAKENK